MHRVKSNLSPSELISDATFPCTGSVVLFRISENKSKTFLRPRKFHVFSYFRILFANNGFNQIIQFGRKFKANTLFIYNSIFTVKLEFST